jgi:hypothetical protein
MTNKEKATELANVLERDGISGCLKDALIDSTTTMLDTTDELNKWEIVHATESLDGLAKVIESFANEEGKIAGSEKWHNAQLMADNCRTLGQVEKHQQIRYLNFLTRRYGIRQQALYLVQ